MCQPGRNTVQITVTACCCVSILQKKAKQSYYDSVAGMTFLLLSPVVPPVCVTVGPPAISKVGPAGSHEETAPASRTLHHQE